MRELRRVYRLIFRLPNTEFLMLLLLAQLSIYFAILHFGYGVHVESVDILLLTTSAVGMPLLLLGVPWEKRALNLKRTLAVINIMMIFLLLSSVLAKLSALLALVVLNLFAILELHVLIGMINWDEWKSAIFTFINVAVLNLAFIRGISRELGLSHSLINAFRFLVKPLLISLLIIAIVLAIIYSYMWIQPLFGKINIMRFMRAFLLLKLDQKRESFDCMLEKVSTEREIPIAITVFRSKRDKKPLFAIVGAQIHPGPLLNSGSSDFPANLFMEIKSRLGIPVVFLKGAASHDANLPSLEEQRKLISFIEKELRDLLTREKWSEEICEPEEYRDENVHIIRLASRDQEYLIASNAPENSDDLDASLGYFALELGRAVGKNIFLVDAHNSLTDPQEGLIIGIDDKEYHTICRLVRTIATKDCKLKQFMIGFAHNKCDGLTLEDGLGNLGIIAIAIKIGEKLHVFVIYDSNNLNPRFYLDMKEAIKREFGAETVELLSTDTHTVCALAPNILYVILGEKKRDLVKKYTIEVVREAIKRLTEAETAGKLIIVKLRVLGKGSTTTIKGLSVAAVKTFIRDIILSHILATLLGIVVLSL